NGSSGSSSGSSGSSGSTRGSNDGPRDTAPTSANSWNWIHTELGAKAITTMDLPNSAGVKVDTLSFALEINRPADAAALAGLKLTLESPSGKKVTLSGKDGE